MKTNTIAAIAAMLVLAALFFAPATAEMMWAEQQPVNLNSELGKIIVTNDGHTAIASSESASNSRCPWIIDYKRTEIGDGMAEYTIKLKVGHGKYDTITISNFVRETSPYKTSATKAMDISPGQSLTSKLYRDRAIELAEDGDISVFVIGKREDNIPPNLLSESELNAVTKKWNMNTVLQDTYYAILVSRIQTAALSGTSIGNIKVVGWGHSLGAKIWDNYDKKDYDQKPFGDISLLTSVDMVMKYDPIYQNLINAQKIEYESIKQEMDGGKYYSDEGATSLYITALAYNPETANEKSELPGLSDYTNLQVFRLMNFATYQFGETITPGFQYLAGDFNGLYDVNEQKMMTVVLNGGVVPYTPRFYDLEVAGQLGEVPEFQTNIDKTDTPIVYFGLKGGVDYYGEYLPRETGKIKDFLIRTAWYSAGGHASIIFEESEKVDQFWRDTAWIVKNV